MIDKTVAETKWCPFALAQSEVKECSVTLGGKLIAVTVLNRTASGQKHPDCLCITENCVWWRRLGVVDSVAYGDCSKLTDNMQSFGDFTDAAMEAQWCPMARPENEVVISQWPTVGCDNAVSSANRVAGGQMNASAKCISKECMAFNAGANDAGYCMAADKNMQR